MSATGRNLEGSERHDHDFYETPGWCTRAILPHLDKCFASGSLRTPRTILDAGSGSGKIAAECAVRFPEAEVFGIEKEEAPFSNSLLLERRGLMFVRGDFFDLPSASSGMGTRMDLLACPFDLIIGNPPYNKAEAFAAHAIRFGHTVALLLRINWLASKKRLAFHRQHPADLYVLPRRPSFTNGGTDATEYAWFVWGKRIERLQCGTCHGKQWFGDHYGGYACTTCAGVGEVDCEMDRGNRWFLLDVESR